MNKKESIKVLIRKILFYSCSGIVSLVPKKEGLVLFTSWFGQKYLDNCKYVYEYFLDNSDYHPVWMTRNPIIYKQLKEEGKPVEMFNTLKGRWTIIRAQAAFASVQFSDYNTWLMPKCVIVDLNHGHPIKDPGAVGETGSYLREVYRMILQRVSFFSIVAGSKTKETYNVVPIPKDHIIISDFARNDVFVDEKLREGKNKVIEEFKKNRRAIVYMPTHRSDGKEIMDMTSILPLDDIQTYCEANNVIFIIKKHFYHRNEHENLNKYPNIIDVTDCDEIDPQVLLYQAEMLISDYSACYIDYMLLQRPIVFYQYDLESYKNGQRKLYYDFDALQIAPVVHAKDKLLPTIKRLLSDGDSYLEKRMKFAQENYFDNIEQKEGRAKVKRIFDNLYNQYIR